MDLPSNSRNLRDEPVGPKVERQKIEPIVKGGVVRKRRSPGKRFREMFVGGDARSVGQYVVLDVLLPALKDMVADAGSQGLERLIFGETRVRGRRPGQSGYVNYSRFSASRTPEREPRREMTRRGRSTHDFDEIVLDSRGEAEEVIDRLFDLVSQYDQVTVADLYDLVGITGNYTDERWGWTDIRGAQVVHTRSGYLLDLPRAEPLK